MEKQSFKASIIRLIGVVGEPCRAEQIVNLYPIIAFALRIEERWCDLSRISPYCEILGQRIKKMSYEIHVPWNCPAPSSVDSSCILG